MFLNSKKKSMIFGKKFIGCPQGLEIFAKSTGKPEDVDSLCLPPQDSDMERMGRRGEKRVSEVERAEKYSPPD